MRVLSLWTVVILPLAWCERQVAPASPLCVSKAPVVDKVTTVRSSPTVLPLRKTLKWHFFALSGTVRARLRFG